MLIALFPFKHNERAFLGRIGNRVIMLACELVTRKGNLRKFLFYCWALHKEGAATGFERVADAQERFVHDLKGSRNDPIHRCHEAIRGGFVPKDVNVFKAQFIDCLFIFFIHKQYSIPSMKSQEGGQGGTRTPTPYGTSS